MNRRLATLAPLMSAFVYIVSGCSGEAPTAEDLGTTGNQRISFDDWAHENLRQQGDNYYFEGDIVLTKEQALAYYEATASASGALWSYSGAYNGIARFAPSGQQNITYCIQASDFSTDEVNRLSSYLIQGMGAWEAVADVRFSYVATTDCASSGRMLRVVALEEGTGAAASCTPPGGGRMFHITKSTINGNATFALAVVQHELGHGLGFGHEHDRQSTCASTGGCGAFDSPYDTSSVMYYVNAPGYTGGVGGGGWNYITQWDLEGAQKVYGAPTDVVNTQDGTVYARQMRTGDFYRRESTGSWTKIGGPGQTFVSLGNTLYGQTPGGGWVVKYISGQTWQGGISGYNGQMLRCGTALCVTDPNTGSIVQYAGSGGSWTTIGGPGARFASSATELFGIEPHQANVARRTSSGWFWSDSGTTTSRELAGGGTSMYRLLTESFGTVQRYTGSNWQSIGTFGVLRQLHATGSDVYVVSGSHGIFRYDGSNWIRITDSAAPVNRLYGSYGYLYGQGTDGSIFTYVAGNWTSLGRP